MQKTDNVKVEINSEKYDKIFNLSEEKDRNVESLIDEAIDYFLKNYQKIQEEKLDDTIKKIEAQFG